MDLGKLYGKMDDDYGDAILKAIESSEVVQKNPQKKSGQPKGEALKDSNLKQHRTKRETGT
jgi:hypothetical protein